MNSKSWFGCGLGVALLIAAGIWWMSLGYAQVSDNGYAFAMALMSICNRQDSQRLEILQEKMDKASQAGELPEYDQRVLADITDRAAAGNWQSATRSVRRLMEDQVQR